MSGKTLITGAGFIGSHLADEWGQPLEPVPPVETRRPDPWAIYALGKHDQEQMALTIGRTYGFDVAALELGRRGPTL
jgi:nucleoside-diphosphate-sugar epimerase